MYRAFTSIKPELSYLRLPYLYHHPAHQYHRICLR